MYGKGGFGIVTVMVGAVVLGIFALVYTQKMQNRANFSLIADLMAFREQVMTYYSSLVANRVSWECTVGGNEPLQRYLATGTAYDRDPLPPPPPPTPTPLPLDANRALAVYDGDGNCQEKFGWGGGATLRIPNDGLGLSLIASANPGYLPAPATGCSSSHFCLTATWEDLCLPPCQPARPIDRRSVKVTLKLVANRRAIKNDLDVSFELADKEHSFYIGRTVATDCSDGRVTGFFPGRQWGRARTWDGSAYLGSTAPGPVGTGVNAYMGDAAVVNFDTVTGLVQCHDRPLVIPPCYDMSDDSYIDDYGTARTRPQEMVNPFLSGIGAPGYRGFQSNHGFEGMRDGYFLRCTSSSTPSRGISRSNRVNSNSIKGKCPETEGNGTTAIAYFDPYTGISQCSHPNILVEKIGVGTTPVDEICENSDNWSGVVRIRDGHAHSHPHPHSHLEGTFECSTHRWGASKGGVEPFNADYPCGLDEAVIGFRSGAGADTGRAYHECREKSAGTHGFPGPTGEHGDSGAYLYSIDPPRGRGPRGPRGIDEPNCPCGY